MRWRRAAALALIVLALVVGAAPAAAVTYIGLHDVTCNGATAMGAGLPRQTSLDIALVDPASGRTLTRDRVTTSATGTLEWRAEVSLSGMRRVRAVVSRPGEAPVAWVEHSLGRACPLASTGTRRTLSLIGVGVSSFTLGVLLLVAFAYQGRHAAAPGRHLAAPSRAWR